MSRKSKGINAERELIHRFWESGWAAHRIAGSGSSRYPSCDVIAGNKLRMLAIECKSTKSGKKYLPKQEIEQLKEFSVLFGAECWVGVRFNRKEWMFLNIEDAKDVGSSYLISKDIAQAKGLLFEELIEK